MTSNRILAGVLAAAVALFGLAGAGVRADGKTEQPKVEVKKGVLTNETLKEMLENLGYNPETIKSTTGTPMSKVRFERDGWTFVFYVSLSDDGTMVWISAPLKDVPDDLGSVEPLKKLLVGNDNVGPCHFTLKGKRIYLNLGLENREVTPVRLRTALDDVSGNVKATQNLWNTDTWPKADSVKKVEEKKSEDKK